jgi:hypothetical protein
VRVVAFVALVAFALGWSTGHAEDRARLGNEWTGYFSGTVKFDTAFPPRAHLLSRDDGESLPSGGPPIRVNFAIGDDEGGSSLWLAIAGGPMKTGPDGETLQFGRSMRLENGKLLTEIEFRQSDGGTWWRYVTLSPAPDGLNVLIWVFDASGARSWAGLVRRED